MRIDDRAQLTGDDICVSSFHATECENQDLPKWRYQQRLAALAELCRLRTLFDGDPEKALVCSSVAVLSRNDHHLLRTGLRMAVSD
ncbi:hypothetical protein T4B_375 [Trichinella pseudospiralis]|uniref:Uncharacterized protein n=1 Tax=Trichinella pseudospiralis TaxID=6337 RepID=A0A0V1HHY1_TRIPS|nr:hypothetical protein T4B_375 [Trichinella pseudospiralis]